MKRNVLLVFMEKNVTRNATARIIVPVTQILEPVSAPEVGKVRIVINLVKKDIMVLAVKRSVLKKLKVRHFFKFVLSGIRNH